jgi:hypothetical protein
MQRPKGGNLRAQGRFLQSATLPHLTAADTEMVRRRIPTDALLATAFAQAVSDGDHLAAEGWFRVALHTQARERDRAPARPRFRLHPAGASSPTTR